MEREKKDVMTQIKEFSIFFSLFSDEIQLKYFKTFLGNIKTPYNKQNLTEKLAGFFFNRENQKRIFTLLDEVDFKILSFVNSIVKPNIKDVELFFKDTKIGFYESVNSCENLVERLVLLKNYDEDTKKSYFVINPILEDLLNPYLCEKIPVENSEIYEKVENSQFFVTPQFLAAVICFVQEFPEMCKINGEIKKKNKEQIMEIFKGNIDAFEIVLRGFIKLGIFKIGEVKISIDWQKLNSFSKLDSFNQFIYLAVAAVDFLSNDNIQKQGQIVLDLIKSFFAENLSFSSILQIVFYSVYGKNSDLWVSKPRRRFSMIVERNSQEKLESFSSSKTDNSDSRYYVFQIFELVLENLTKLGILKVVAKNRNSENIYSIGSALENLKSLENPNKKLLNIDAGTNVTVLPGLNLEELIEIIPFLKLNSADFITQFEITKKSVSNAFSCDFSVENVICNLQKYSTYEIPDILKINIEEWFNSYSGAVIYEGFVLKVDEKNKILFENNPKFAKLISKKLADGIYFLNIPLDSDSSKNLKSFDMDFVNSVEKARVKNLSSNFTEFQNGRNIFINQKENLTPWNLNSEERKSITESLLSEADKLILSEDELLDLRSRIKRKIIVNSNQIQNRSAKIEILEVSGMDYSGKIHLIKTAISLKEKIEISVPAENDSSKMQIFFGLPQLLTKAEDSAIVRITIEPENIDREFSVGRIMHIKMVRH